jgi:hypothetical protein
MPGEWEQLPWWHTWLLMKELNNHLAQQAGEDPQNDTGHGESSGDIMDLLGDLNFKVEKVD